MNDHDDHDIPDLPPPSYEEATGRVSTTHRPGQSGAQFAPPPPLPPRASTSSIPQPQPQSSSSTATKPNNTSNNPFINSSQPPQTFQQLLPQPLHPARQFPPTINLYRDPFPTAPQRRFFLGPHQHHPLYALSSFFTGLSLAAPVSLVLHNGASDDAAPLAVAWGQRPVCVSLPPLPNHQPQQQPQPVLFNLPGFAVGSAVASFTVEVPWSGQWHKESFEWRRSSGSAVVDRLGGSSSGWTLVRLSNALPPPQGPAAAAVVGKGPPSGDGHEVVAVCAHAVMSMTKLWKFAFLGTGVSGALGERWAVMAVITGLVLWDREGGR